MCVRWVGGDVRSISKNRPSQHKSPTHFLLVAYLKTSGMNGSKRAYANLALPPYPVSKEESQMSKTKKNRPGEKLHNRQD